MKSLQEAGLLQALGSRRTTRYAIGLELLRSGFLAVGPNANVAGKEGVHGALNFTDGALGRKDEPAPKPEADSLSEEVKHTIGFRTHWVG